MPKIDLKELASRENEQVEWKENVADVEDAVATITAFANDLANLGGGYVVCGAKETRDAAGFPAIERIGLDAKRLAAVEGEVLDRCRKRVDPQLAPLVEELPAEREDRRILVFIVPASQRVHQLRHRARGTPRARGNADRPDPPPDRASGRPVLYGL